MLNKIMMIIVAMIVSVYSLDNELEWHRDVVPVKNDSLLLLNSEKKVPVKKVDKPLEKPEKVYLKDAVKGIVVDKKTGKQIAGAEIKINNAGKDFSVLSDESGVFVVKGVKPGSIEVEINNKGYEPVNKKFVTEANGELVEFFIEKKVLKAEMVTIKKPTKKGGKLNQLNKRKKSNAVVDGMSAEAISKGTDSDAGALAKRVTGTSVVGGKYVFVRGLGERYTNMTLNGLPVPTPEKDKRVVPQDLFPAGALESFSIYKTYSPDLLPDFAGGNIALVTKGIPEKDVLKIKVGVGAKDYLSDTRFTTIGNDRLTYDGGNGFVSYLGYDDGTRQKPNGVPVAVDRSWTSDQLAVEAWKFNNKWKFDTTQVFINQSYGLELAKVFKGQDKSKYGFLASLSFSNKFDQESSESYTLRRDNVLDSNNRIVTDSVTKIDEEGNEYGTFENLYWTNPIVNKNKTSGVAKTRKTAILNMGYEDEDKTIWFKNLYAHLSSDKATITRKEDSETSNENSGELEEIFTTEYSSRAIFTSQLGFGLFTGMSFLDSLSGAVGTGISLGETPDQKAYLFLRNRVDEIATSDTTINGVNYKNGEEYSYYDDPRFVIGPSFGVRFYDDFVEKSFSSRLDQYWIVPPEISVEDTLLKEGNWVRNWKLPTLVTGMFTNYKDREYNLSRYEWLGLEYSVDKYGGYEIVDEIFHQDSVYKYVSKNGSGFSPTPSEYDSYTAVESEFSTYFNLNTGIELFSFPISVDYGLRLQWYNNNVSIPYTGKEFLSKPEKRAEKNLSIKSNEMNLYPSYGMSIQWTKNTKLKLAHSETMIRPELRELIPTNFYDYEEDTNVKGNVDLVNTEVKHYDARLDWYLPFNQMISGSFFYKNFKNPIEFYIDAASAPVIKKYVNADEAFVRGVEVEADLNLGKVLEVFDLNTSVTDLLTFYMNAAWIESKVEIDEEVATAALLTSEKRSMIGQSPWLYNLKLSIENDIDKVNLVQSMLYNISGPRIIALGNLNVGDAYEEAFASLDYAAKIKYGQHSISFKMKNILNSIGKIRYDEVNKNIERETLDSEYVDALYDQYDDRIIIEDEKGISYSISYTYSFL